MATPSYYSCAAPPCTCKYTISTSVFLNNWACQKTLNLRHRRCVFVAGDVLYPGEMCCISGKVRNRASLPSLWVIWLDSFTRTLAIFLLASRVALKFAINFVVLQAILRQVWTYFWMIYDPESKTDGWRREVGASTASVKISGVFLLHLGVLGGHVV